MVVLKTKKKVLVVFGTRPEAIKLAPLILKIRKEGKWDCSVCVTAQHREMLDMVLSLFQIQPDFDLQVMEERQTLPLLSSRILLRMEEVLKKMKPHLVVVQGDTTTAFISALSAFYEKIPVAHVEAGLRSFDRFHPFPEEMNRILVDHLSDFLFAPTSFAKENLLKEGIGEERIFVTGNTIIDALHEISRSPLSPLFCKLTGIQGEGSWEDFPTDGRKILLVTAHRRENWGEPMEKICTALKRIAELFGKDVLILFPVHLNPVVREKVFQILEGVENIVLTDPLDYLTFVQCLRSSYLVLTDSGGVQEEAPAFGKPILVLRETTERPEGVKLGNAILVGTDPERIVGEVKNLLENPSAYEKMAKVTHPYGDGKASERIVDILSRYL